MNVRKPLIICKTAHAITIVTDGCAHLPKFPVEGSRPNLKEVSKNISRAFLGPVTAPARVIGLE